MGYLEQSRAQCTALAREQLALLFNYTSAPRLHPDGYPPSGSTAPYQGPAALFVEPVVAHRTRHWVSVSAPQPLRRRGRLRASALGRWRRTPAPDHHLLDQVGHASLIGCTQAFYLTHPPLSSLVVAAYLTRRRPRLCC